MSIIGIFFQLAVKFLSGTVIIIQVVYLPIIIHI